MFWSRLDWGYGLCGRKTPEIEGHFPHIPSEVYTPKMTHRCDVALNIYELREYLSVSPPKVTLYPHSMLFPLERYHYAQLTLKG